MINRVTESSSNNDNLEKMSTHEILEGINSEDQKVASCVHAILPEIEAFVNECTARMWMTILHWRRNEWTARNRRCKRVPSDFWGRSQYRYRNYGRWRLGHSKSCRIRRR